MWSSNSSSGSNSSTSSSSSNLTLRSKIKKSDSQQYTKVAFSTFCLQWGQETVLKWTLVTMQWNAIWSSIK